MLNPHKLLIWMLYGLAYFFILNLAILSIAGTNWVLKHL